MRIVSGSEPAWLRATAAKVSNAGEAWGSDIFDPVLKLGIQRKAVPDFIASSNDGRLAQQVQQMKPLPWKFLIIEGRMRWTQDGDLIGDKWMKFSQRQMIGILITIQLAGVVVLFSDDGEGTLNLIDFIEKYVAKPTHSFLNTRSKVGIEASWGQPDDRDWQRFLVSSFPGINSTLADRILDTVGMPFKLAVTEDALKLVPGLGEKKVRGIVKCLTNERATVSTTPSPKPKRKRAVSTAGKKSTPAKR